VVINVVAEAVPVALTVPVDQVQAAVEVVRAEIAQAVRVRDNNYSTTIYRLDIKA